MINFHIKLATAKPLLVQHWTTTQPCY